MSDAVEVNFDGIVGPTHNYSGLSPGNLASEAHVARRSNPRRAALQGLAKMRALADLGIPQAVLPPQERPAVWALRRLGFSGSDAEVLAVAASEPRLLAAAGSASPMWAANAATVSPSADCADGRVHFTPANLASNFHRFLEPPTTARVLKKIFADDSAFAHHDPLPNVGQFADEGAANHLRLAARHGDPGTELFVYGRLALTRAPEPDSPKLPARQTREASEAIARLHGLDPARTLFLRQSPRAIDAGAFHNDVVAVANENVLLYHEAALDLSADIETALRSRHELIRISEGTLPLAEAVRTYLFNSQLVTLPDGQMSLIAPEECLSSPAARAAVEEILAARSPITSVRYVDVRQSMDNGGGPACLRLRVVLTPRELSLFHPGVRLDDDLHGRLAAWVERHYREELTPADLADPALLRESRDALDALTSILGLGAIYPFQTGEFG